MLNRQSAVYFCMQATRLRLSPKFQVSRALRRFLSDVVTGRFVFQSFAFEEGHSAQQLSALTRYAEGVDASQQKDLGALGFKRLGTMCDETFGSINNGYELDFDIKTATLPQLQSVVSLVRVLAAHLEEFALDPAQAAGFEDYRYRSLPCSIVTDEALWTVGGHDVRGGSGVLEWCYDQADANEVLKSMQRFPDRFKNLKAEPFAAQTGMHWAVAQATQEEAVA